MIASTSAIAAFRPPPFAARPGVGRASAPSAPGFVLLDRLAGDVMPGVLEQFDDGRTRRIVGVGARVGDRQHEHPDMRRGGRLVVLTTHRSIIVVAMKRWLPAIALVLLGMSQSSCALRATEDRQPALDKTARVWVETTLKKLTLEQAVGHMIFAAFNSTYMSSDSEEYDRLATLIHESHIGGVIAFGGTEPV